MILSLLFFALFLDKVDVYKLSRCVSCKMPLQIYVSRLKC